MIFFNPFYCGIISNKLLDGILVEGQHEKLISKDTFLAVHNVRAEAGTKYGILQK